MTSILILFIASFVSAEEISELKCPEESTPVHRSYSTECCLKQEGKSHCVRHGTLELRDMYTGKTLFQRTNYINGKKEGLFQEWYDDSKTVRVSGQYKNDQPHGEWKFNGGGSARPYTFRYDNGKLTYIKTPTREVKEIRPPQSAKAPRVVGFDQPGDSTGIGIATHQPLSMVAQKITDFFLYSEETKKHVSGIAVGNYRFLYDTVRTSHILEANGRENINGVRWGVISKNDKVNSCLTHLSNRKIEVYEVTPLYWYPCQKYVSLLEYIKEEVVYGEGTPIFTSPGGTQRLEARELHSGGVVEGKYLGKRRIKGEWWIKVGLQYEAECPQGKCEEYPIIGWTPLYDKNQIVPYVGF